MIGRRQSRRQNGGGREWVGGRLSAPMYITEGEPYRPDLILWLELPEGSIVGTALVHPSEPPSALAAALRAAMEHPMVGPPRRPDRIRIAEPALAEEVGAAIGDHTRVRVAPTPELDAVAQDLASAAVTDFDAGVEPESYLEDGRVSPQTVAKLFRAADLLFRLAPWKHVSDADVLRVDIPQLGVAAACLSIIGALGESFGMLLFPSLAAYETFGDAAERSSRGGVIDLGTTFLSLSFERGADIPAAMRREVAEHGWPVASAAAYPRVAVRERDGMLRPLVDEDVRLAAACASALTAFCVKHERFGDESFGPVCESYTDADDLTVRFTLPYEAAPLFDVGEPPPRAPAASARVGRNDPCPCGSGKKYKKCHLGAEAPPQSRHDDEDAGADDAQLVDAILGWAARRFGTDWAEPIRSMDDAWAQLAVPWCGYHAAVGERRIAERFLEAREQQLSAGERDWLQSQLAAWLSIWEVAEVEPGAGVRVTDLLSGETRYVYDRTASRTLVRRDTVLARVVDHRGTSTFCGLAPRGLPPWDAAEVVRRVRARLRLRRAVPVERLRDEAIGRFMLARWQEAVADLDHRASIPPALQNTDGDPLFLTADHFAFDAAARGEVEARLTALGAVAVSEPAEAEHCYQFVKGGGEGHDDGETIIGLARVTDAALIVETNSIARADDLRHRIGDACGGLIRFRIRDHSDPRALFGRGGARDGGAASGLDPLEKARIERDLKQRYYERWLDEPVPALDGRTPRAAARTRDGRHRVDVLLRDIENRESRLPSDQQIDFAPLRRALGLDE